MFTKTVLAIIVGTSFVAAVNFSKKIFDEIKNFPLLLFTFLLILTACIILESIIYFILVLIIIN